MVLLRPALAAIVPGVVLSAGLVACSSAPEVPDPGPAARQLADGLAAGELTGPLTESQGEYDALLDDALAGTARTVEVVGTRVAEPEREDAAPSEATATLRWTWDLTEAGGAEWRYETRARLTRSGQRWSPRWEPAVVHPELREGYLLDLAPLPADRGDIVGAGRANLVTERPVTRFGIAKDQVPPRRAARSARRLAGLLDIDPGPFVRRVRAAGERAFVEGLVLRREDISVRIGSRYAAIPGALALKDTLPLAPSTAFARPILGSVGPVTAEMITEDPDLSPGEERGITGLQARYDEQLAGTPGLRVAVLGADGASTTVHEEPARDGDELRVSLDAELQARAERLLAEVEPASALVAVRPSDGAVLAAASGPGAEGVNLATYGQAAPGSTFKIVSALALLRVGVAPTDPVECPASTVVDGKRFENYDDYPPTGLGRITLLRAVADSCNTAFVGSADRIGRTGLADAAASLGLGIDHDLGFPAYFGQVPPPQGRTEAAADTIGQGAVLASPMAMATVMASVVRGRTVVPWLVDEVRSEVPDEAEPLTEAESRQLRSLLREVVRSGSGRLLADLPGPPVLAKTGTAEFDRDGRRLLHAWMVAGQGDLAVAVYVDVGASGSRTAGPILARFLR